MTHDENKAQNSPLYASEWNAAAKQLNVVRKAPSYIIYKTDGLVRALNCKTNEIQFENASASTVINNVFGVLTDGGVIFFRQGTYTITAQLTPTYDKLQLCGEGRENTVLKLGANVHLLSLENDIDDVTIRDLSFDGTKATYNTDYWCGVSGATVKRILIENCDFHDFEGKGCYGTQWSNFHIRNCRFYNNDQDGLYLEGIDANFTKQGQITDCIAYGNARKGFNNGRIKDITFKGCIAYSNTGDGWNLEGSTDGSYILENTKLIGCTAFSNGENGFRVQRQVYNVALIDCDAYTNTASGLYIRGDDSYIMRNIRVIGGSYYENNDHGINVSYGMKHVKITDLSVYNNDAGAGSKDGISFSETTNFEHILVCNIHAYDNQGAHTQDYGVDFGTGDESAKDICVCNVWGEGNTSGLFRGTITAKFNIQGIADRIVMNDGLLVDPKNHADATLSGTEIIIEIEVNGSPYYFKVSPTKA